MKKRTKYLIARLVIMALCVALGFGMGWTSKETEVYEIKVENPIVRVCEPATQTKKVKVSPTYTEIKVKATAYCPCIECCGKTDGITASGTLAKENHTVAADPNIFPYGTKIFCSMGEFVVEDCGSAIKGKNRLDFFFDTHEEALEFGVKEFSIWIMEEK